MRLCVLYSNGPTAIVTDRVQVCPGVTGFFNITLCFGKVVKMHMLGNVPVCYFPILYLSRTRLTEAGMSLNKVAG